MCEVNREWTLEALVILKLAIDENKTISSLPFKQLLRRRFEVRDVSITQEDVSQFLHHHWAIGTFGKYYKQKLTKKGYLVYKVPFFNRLKKLFGV